MTDGDDITCVVYGFSKSDKDERMCREVERAKKVQKYTMGNARAKFITDGPGDNIYFVSTGVIEAWAFNVTDAAKKLRDQGADIVIGKTVSCTIEDRENPIFNEVVANTHYLKISIADITFTMVPPPVSFKSTIAPEPACADIKPVENRVYTGVLSSWVVTALYTTIFVYKTLF